MHINELRGGFLRFSTYIVGLLSILFWVLLIYGFDEPYAAGLTVISAVVHELGHLAVLGRRGGSGLRGALSGFRIRKNKFNSYKEDFVLAAAGPLANILCALLTLPFLSRLGDYGVGFVSVSLATAAANLLPVKGHDGYNMLLSAVLARDGSERGVAALEAVSGGVGACLCIFSLYLLDRVGEGYWLFAVFFLSLLGEMGRRLG